MLMKRKTRNKILARLVWYWGVWMLFGTFYWLHTVSPYLTCLVLAVSSVEGVLALSNWGTWKKETIRRVGEASIEERKTWEPKSSGRTRQST